jgi:hypothetical protein
VTHTVVKTTNQTYGWELVECSCGATFTCEPNWTIREAYEAHLRAARKADADK